jgi:hypothetical protein
MTRVTLLALLVTAALGARRKRSSSSFTVLTPPVDNLRRVGVVMNPGGLVESSLYTQSMQKWQAEAQKAGVSLYVTLLSYWFSLPIPIRTKANINNSIKQMQDLGLPKDAPVYFTGHSMGGGAPLPIVQELYEEGVLSGAILQAAFITRQFLPPQTASLAFKAPTLTVAAELNYGSARVSRMAEAVYHQPEATHPVVLIEGMNHGQYFTGGSFEDLKPEISHEEAQDQQAKLAMDWLAKELGLGSGSLVKSAVARSKSFFEPFIVAGELEGSRSFNNPNQVGTPNWVCPRGVCEAGSAWISEAQAYIAGKDVMAAGTKLQNNFADLFPFAGGDREGRKPFIKDNTIQAYVMASNRDGDLGYRDGKDHAADASPFTTGELLAKFISRQNAGKTLMGRNLARDGDLCAELNAQAYEYALRNAGAKTRQRFEAHGQALAFDSTKYEAAGPLWVYGKMSWKEKSGKMHLQSRGLLTDLGNKEIDGNHYCKLLSPARAMEWVYVEGLQANLKGDWQ